MVFSSSVRGEVSTHRYLCHDGLTVSGTCLRRIRDVDMKRDFAFVVRISLPCSISSLSLAHEHKHGHAYSIFIIYYVFCKYDLVLRLLFNICDNRNLVTLEMLMMQDIA